MRRRSAQRGFTLMELLVTLGITTVALMGLMALHVSVSRGNDAAARGAEASQIGNATLEELRKARIADMVQILTSTTTASPPIDVTLSTQAGARGMTYRRRVLVTALNSASTSLWQIRVEVGWTDDGAAQGQGLDHLVAVEVIRTVEEAL
jgi:prepilin-type N-terminal cleavage/methylation domain-containing protein